MFLWSFSPKNKSTKELLIFILGSTYPLKINQINQHLKKRFNFKVSYQAIRKAILELKEKEIIEETEEGWKLSGEWINNSFNFFHKLKDSYRSNPFFNSLITEGDMTTINLKSLNELDEFFYEFLENLNLSQNKKSVIFCLNHGWRALLYPHKHNKILNDYSKECYIVYSGKTSLDDWCAKFEEKIGAFVLTGTDFNSSCDTYVIEDLVIQIYIPADTIKRINSIYSSANEKGGAIENLLSEISQKRSKIILIINRNQSLASQIRNQIKDLFIKNHK